MSHPMRLGSERLLPIMSKDIDPFWCHKCPPIFIQLSLLIQKLFRGLGTFRTPCIYLSGSAFSNS